MAKNAYFSLSTHIKQLLVVTFCAMTAGIGSGMGQAGRRDGWDDGTYGRTDFNVDMIM